jgi:hypothetical protein
MSSSTTYTLQVGSVSVTPKADNLLITLDGVIQHTPDAYTVSGSTLTFASAPGTGADFYGIIMGQSASTGQGSIGADELKVTGDGSANQFLAGDGDGTFTFKDGTLSTTTTTGDIIYRANSSALARLGIGSTGQVLTVASGVPAWSTDTEAYLPSVGGTMSGPIAMGGNNISGGGTITGTFVGGITGNVTGNTSGSSGSTTGNAATATTLATARNINGVSFNGSAAITVTADANTLSGTTLKSTVVSSSLTSVGTIGTGVWNASVIASAKLDADTAHLSGSQTFTGDKTFSDNVIITTADDDTTTALKVLALDDGGYTGTVLEAYGTRGPSTAYNIAKFGTNASTPKIVFTGEGKVLIADNLVVGSTTYDASDYQFSQNLIVKGGTPALILDETDADGFITMYANAGEQYLMYDHSGSLNIKHATSTGGSNGTDVLTLSGSGNATFAGTASIKYGLTIDPSGTNSRLLQITNTETGNFNEMVDVLAPNASNDIHTAGIYFGRARSTDELGHITFIPSASSSQSQIALGIWSRNDLLKLRGDGQATFAGQILGSASGVSYSFTGDTDTGIQSGGTNTLQITTAGAKALDFDANQYASFTGNVTFGGQKTQHYSGWETQTIAFGSAITGWSSNNTGARISVPLHATAGQAHGSFQFYTNKGDTEVYALEIHQDGTLKSNLTGAWNMIDTRESGTDKGHILLVNGSTNVGQIISASSSCAFTSLSDYRMKENEVAISDGITRLKQLKPYSFNFKIEPDKTYDGFFAHEVSSIVPEAVIGTKDGVDGDGEIVAQGIDQSKLVPLLVSALQEAIDRIEALENA